MRHCSFFSNSDVFLLKVVPDDTLGAIPKRYATSISKRAADVKEKIPLSTFESLLTIVQGY